MNVAGRLLGTIKSGHHLQINNKTRGIVTPVSASGAPAEILLIMREGEGKSHDSAKDNVGEDSRCN